MDDAWNKDVMSISHRGMAFSDIYRRADGALRNVMGVPENWQIMFVGSATEAMERITQGVVDNRSHHYVDGAFSKKWLSIAKALEKEVTSVTVPDGSGFGQDIMGIPEDVELLCITHNETSTGVMWPEDTLAGVARGSRALVALDVVSSAPMVPIDFTKFDAVFLSVQKAFGLPAGLGVLMAGPGLLGRADDLLSRGLSVGSYHSLPELATAARKFQTPATPNVQAIYLLGRVAEDMAETGIEALQAENQHRAEILYDVLNSSRELEPFVQDGEWRSQTVVVTGVRGGNDKLHGQLADRGLIIGKGYKPYGDEHLRIANFPSIDQEEFDRVVSHLVQFGSLRV
jgi:phosphoserine aminotransferase